MEGWVHPFMPWLWDKWKLCCKNPWESKLSNLKPWEIFLWHKQIFQERSWAIKEIFPLKVSHQIPLSMLCSIGKCWWAHPARSPTGLFWEGTRSFLLFCTQWKAQCPPDWHKALVMPTCCWKSCDGDETKPVTSSFSRTWAAYSITAKILLKSLFAAKIFSVSCL